MQERVGAGEAKGWRIELGCIRADLARYRVATTVLANRTITSMLAPRIATQCVEGLRPAVPRKLVATQAGGLLLAAGPVLLVATHALLVEYRLYESRERQRI